jgi:hypothetical protein
MVKRLTLTLSKEQRNELIQLRDHAAKPYLRERAAALLKVADGATVHHVALYGLLKPRDPDSVYSWLRRYLAGGVTELQIREGRGRKPAFSPSVPK